MSDEAAITYLSKQAVSAATPLVLAGVGELVAQRAGVINVGIEGLMLVGCLAAYAGAGIAGSGPAGVGAGAVAGMLLAAIFALATLWLRADQIVSGTALNLLALGIVGLAWRSVETLLPVLPPGATFDPWALPGLSRLGFFGPVLFQQHTLTYLLGLLVLTTWAFLRFTRAGLILRALGDSPAACAAAGVPVPWVRTACVLFAGLCAGAAGSYLSIMRTHIFSLGSTGGRGFLVLALVIFGRWNIWGLTAGCFLFGLVDALQEFLQAGARGTQIPGDFFLLLPYLATLVALTILTRHSRGPAALGK